MVTFSFILVKSYFYYVTKPFNLVTTYSNPSIFGARIYFMLKVPSLLSFASSTHTERVKPPPWGL